MFSNLISMNSSRIVITELIYCNKVSIVKCGVKKNKRQNEGGLLQKHIFEVSLCTVALHIHSRKT